MIRCMTTRAFCSAAGLWCCPAYSAHPDIKRARRQVIHHHRGRYCEVVLPLMVMSFSVTQPPYAVSEPAGELPTDSGPPLRCFHQCLHTEGKAQTVNVCRRMVRVIGVSYFTSVPSTVSEPRIQIPPAVSAPAHLPGTPPYTGDVGIPLTVQHRCTVQQHLFNPSTGPSIGPSLMASITLVTAWISGYPSLRAGYAPYCSFTHSSCSINDKTARRRFHINILHQRPITTT